MGICFDNRQRNVIYYWPFMDECPWISIFDIGGRAYRESAAIIKCA